MATLVITGDGRKLPVGLWLGDTENRIVVTDLLARGLDASGGLLVVIDGAKALAAGVLQQRPGHPLTLPSCREPVYSRSPGLWRAYASRARSSAADAPYRASI